LVTAGRRPRFFRAVKASAFLGLRNPDGTVVGFLGDVRLRRPRFFGGVGEALAEKRYPQQDSNLPPA
jgi:hypothetical protein